jgi:hypothetical protein
MCVLKAYKVFIRFTVLHVGKAKSLTCQPQEKLGRFDEHFREVNSQLVTCKMIESLKNTRLR